MKSQSRRLMLLGFLLACLMATAPAGRAQGPAILINEILVGNLGQTLDPDYTNFSSWIELRNTTNGSITLKNYRLVSLPDGAGAPQTYTLPKNLALPAGGYRLIWADGRNSGGHASFELDMDGGELTLRDKNNAVIDTVAFGEQSPGVAYGRAASNTWGYFDQPTPEAANDTPSVPTNDDDAFAAAPQFSAPGGRHNNPLAVSLASPDAGATIRYTTDGSRPTTASPIYSSPIAVNNVTVLRARAWLAGKMVSPTVTQTYLVNVPANLPVISLVTDPANLWDPQFGIYIKGNNGSTECNVTANWHRKWERPAAIEFYEIDGTPRLNQEVGVEIFGNCTRNYARKSLEIKARKLYGDNDMDYAFFAGDKPMLSYKRLVLRNAGQDNGNALLRDALAQELVRGRMDVDRQAYRPAVVYLNGAYWGMYDMREKMDEDFVENNYGLDEDEFDMLEQNAFLINGNAAAWKTFYKFIQKANLTQPAVYDQVRAMMDVDEFMNYLIPHIFGGITSWPQRNTRFWDDHGPAYRWRWVLRDLDPTFEPPGLNQDTLREATRSGGPTTRIIKQLVKNPAFLAEFAQRMAVHLNTTYAPSRVNAIIDGMAAAIRPEMPAHVARWGQPASMAAWENSVTYLYTFTSQRPAILRGLLRKWLPGKPADATLTVQIEGNGQVMVAGAAVDDGYSGPHFMATPLTLTATAGPGQSFVRWQETGETAASITLSLSGDTTHTAVFEGPPPPPAPPALVINEIHHSPVDDDTYEFLEIYNPGANAVDLSGFTLLGVTFTFPPGSSIAAGEYIVVADTPASYSGQGYQVFDFSGGLSGSGETVTIFDTYNQAADSVTYGTVTPWPANTNATDLSTSLLNPTLDNTVATNWTASAQTGGTPGAVNFP